MGRRAEAAAARSLAPADLPAEWAARLGALGRLPNIRAAAVAIRADLLGQKRWLYAEDLAELAARCGVAKKDLMVAADLLAVDKVIHYAGRPDQRVDESVIMQCDTSSLRCAYVIDASV